MREVRIKCSQGTNLPRGPHSCVRERPTCPDGGTGFRSPHHQRGASAPDQLCAVPPAASPNDGVTFFLSHDHSAPGKCRSHGLMAAWMDPSRSRGTASAMGWSSAGDHLTRISPTRSASLRMKSACLRSGIKDADGGAETASHRSSAMGGDWDSAITLRGEAGENKGWWW